MIDYLFDRIINVTLTRSPQSIGINAKRMNTIIDNVVIGFCEGEVGSVYEEGTENVLSYTAFGPVYTFTNMEEMMKGRRPNGGFFHKGDRIVLTTDSSRWHVTTSPINDSLHYKLVSTESSANVMSMHIECPATGMKPDINFSVSVLPGQACYKAILKIKNLCIDTVDIRTWETMTIEAGYRHGTTVKFTCPIFSSYLESPNPDGVVAFEGITVGQVGNIMTTAPINVTFKKNKVTVYDVLSAMTPAIGSNVSLEDSLAKEVRDMELTVSTDNNYYFDNSLSMINWMQSFLGDAVRKQYPGTNLVIQLFNDKLKVFWLNGKNTIASLRDEVISLDCVKGASYSGTALSVSAVWNPRLLPGDLFFMPPAFFNGSKLPNVLKASDYTNPDNLYRIITMSINFGTVDGNNEMQLLAMPAQYIEQFSTPLEGEMTADKIEAALAKEYNAHVQEAKDVTVGGSTQDVSASSIVTQKKTGNQLIDNSSSLEAQLSMNMSTVSYNTGSGPAYVGDKPYDRSCLSKLCEFFYCYDPSGPKMKYNKEGIGADCGHFQVDIETLRRDRKDFTKYWVPGGIPVWAVFTPIVAALTYWKRKQVENETGSPGVWDLVVPEKIGEIEKNTLMLMPVLRTGYNDLKQFKDLFKDAYKQYFVKGSDYIIWARDYWKPCYYYLGGMDEF